MRGGIAVLLGAVAIAAAGCAERTGKIEVRAIGDPGEKLGGAGDRLAVARGQLALGNVGLAMEGFHAALREQPDSIEAMGGLAASYDTMGRTDLSRHYYEMALAIAPHNAAVLNAFAASLYAQGQRAAAQELRSEAALASARQSPGTAGTTAIAGQVAGPTVTVALPAAPSGPVAGPTVTVPLPPARLAAEPGPSATVAAVVDRTGPRLERLSPGEVALLTAGEPAWQPTVVERTAQATTVRWVALDGGTERPNIRVLNAARTAGLAARTRDYLMARGWRRIEIGDAAAPRDVSLIMVPEDRATMGRSLAAQFGFRPSMRQQGRMIVMLLGRDAAGKGAQVRG